MKLLILQRWWEADLGDRIRATSLDWPASLVPSQKCIGYLAEATRIHPDSRIQARYDSGLKISLTIHVPRAVSLNYSTQAKGLQQRVTVLATDRQHIPTRSIVVLL